MPAFVSQECMVWFVGQEPGRRIEKPFMKMKELFLKPSAAFNGDMKVAYAPTKE